VCDGHDRGFDSFGVVPAPGADPPHDLHAGAAAPPRPAPLKPQGDQGAAVAVTTRSPTRRPLAGGPAQRAGSSDSSSPSRAGRQGHAAGLRSAAFLAPAPGRSLDRPGSLRGWPGDRMVASQAGVGVADRPSAAGRWKHRTENPATTAVQPPASSAHDG
jgi:hypothetical protein